MAINDSATLVINSGNYFTAPVGTEVPANLRSIGGAWEPIGHTSIEDIYSQASDGGEATILSTLQNASLRTRYAPRTETISVILQQFDKPALKLYYGANAIELADGSLGVPTNPVPTERAFLAVFYDGDNVFAVYAPRASIFRGDDLSISDTESLASLPLAVTPLQYQDNEYTYSVTPIAGATSATTATAGAPGSFNGDAPANFAGMASLTASPTTAWTTGQYVTLGDASRAYWNGMAWAVGTAA